MTLLSLVCVINSPTMQPESLLYDFVMVLVIYDHTRFSQYVRLKLPMSLYIS
jgi:hypothetical protein